MRLSLIVLIFCLPTFACTRYWVGGGSSGTWAATANTNWAASSGGANNASVPTTTDDVCFDVNSGTGTSSVGAATTINSIDCTGYTGALNLSATVSYEVSALFVPAMTLNGGGWTFIGSTSSGSLTTGGKSIASPIVNGTGTLSLQDDLSTSNNMTLTKGTFVTGGHAVSANSFISTGSNARALNLGATAFTVSGSGTVWSLTSTGMTLTPGTSTIIVANIGSSGKTFAGGGLTYANIGLAGGGTGTVTFTGANTFSGMTINPPKTVTFPASSTTTVGSFSATGTPSSPITIQSSSGGTQATLSQASGTVNAFSLTLTDSNVTGGATWNAYNSANTSNNTGWNFLTASIFVPQAGAFLVGP